MDLHEILYWLMKKFNMWIDLIKKKTVMTKICWNGSVLGYRIKQIIFCSEEGENVVKSVDLHSIACFISIYIRWFGCFKEKYNSF